MGILLFYYNCLNFSQNTQNRGGFKIKTQKIIVVNLELLVNYCICFL